MEHPETASRAVARSVRAALSTAGISHRQASEQTGIPLTTLHRRLTGATPFTVNELHQLAVITGTTVAALVATTQEGAA